MAGFFENFGNSLGSLTTNPQFIAALGQINPGVGQSLTQAALLQQQQQEQARVQQEHQNRQQEQQRMMMLQQKLPEIIQTVDWNDPQKAQQQLSAIGMTPQEMVPLFNMFAGNQRLGIEQEELGLRKQELGKRNADRQRARQEEEMAVADMGLLPGETPQLAAQRKKSESMETKEDDEELHTISEGKNIIKQMRKDLDKIAYTGPGAEFAYKNVGPLASIASEKLGKKLGVAEAEDFSAKSFDLLAPKIQKMKGALSDKDIAFLMKQIPNLGNSKAGNKKIMDDIEKQFDRAEKMIKAKKMYQKQFGTTQGFAEKWKQYADSNPLLGE